MWYAGESLWWYMDLHRAYLHLLFVVTHRREGEWWKQRWDYSPNVLTMTFAISARVMMSLGRKVLLPFTSCPEKILIEAAPSIYFARSEFRFTSMKVIVVGSVTVTQRVTRRIFAASARLIGSLGRNRKLLLIIPLSRASATYWACHEFTETSLYGRLNPMIGRDQPVVPSTIFRNSARVSQPFGW